MRIKKIYQGELPENKILNVQSESATDTYSCDYINNLGVGGGDALDELPIGSVIRYDGEDIPEGWEEVQSYEIIERGETATGTYTKWADGKMEWVGSVKIEQIPCDITVGSMFRCQGNTYGNIEFGVTFTEKPKLLCNASGNYPIYLASVGNNGSNTATGYVLIVNCKNEVVWDETFTYLAIGKWK